jgi:hypothetical protein
MTNNKAIMRALAIIDRKPLIQRPAQPTIQVHEPTVGALDLPRVCALHQRPYVSRYISDGREFHYAQSIRMTDSLLNGQYNELEVQSFDTAYLEHEHCPWCGAYSDSWTGPIACTGCCRLLCFGTTVRDYFRCPCGKESRLIGGDRGESGFVPGYRTRSSGGV